jgi:hypothetical protein
MFNEMRMELKKNVGEFVNSYQKNYVKATHKKREPNRVPFFSI